MTTGNRCDGPACATFSPPGDRRWLYLVCQPDSPPSPLAALGIGPVPVEPLTFCSMRCVAQYAWLEAVVPGPATGAEPAPRSGTGWPGQDTAT